MKNRLKFFFAVPLVALYTATAFAQQQPSPPGVADPVKLTISRQTLLAIGQALQELPAKIANPILNDLQAQLAAADKAVADEVAKKAEEAKKTEPPPKSADQKAD